MPDLMKRSYVILIAVILMQTFNQLSKSANRQFVDRLISQVGDGEDVTRIAFIIAHPDDESMFFTPLLEYIGSCPIIKNIHLDLLCLTRGDYMGQGDRRTKEMMEICRKYSMNCIIDNDPSVKDGPDDWNIEAVSHRVEDFIRSVNAKMVFTFDEHGVSGHPNHKSVHKAVKRMKSRYKDIRVWCLRSHGILVKYFPPYVIVKSFLNPPSISRFSPLDVGRNMAIHKSQQRWYTIMWVLFSSYSYTNTFDIMVE
ncbi:putative N-acetylglucosaminylphosphatidylinositol deacetylase [Babesia bovis T2Bo]|uniref:N-acetylglucosaminylphosphatidylinositol deacetylase n=1 Tax=Babesia bovis TaxID=5865 RepID=A7ANY5_BABBO|nr:putative N-acetylglucosaminylphosphatidylinositol deacetylase [Babesia bovis T2Bo]EDO08269.1 putative N-acetylglucosaminylphosphatidylinositol deacetylase [Babesia bovis T2Bo]|eukprot:XP_001611837.1 N-acetylglucosaminyl-phosphatidylinositol de-n-acetylase [Babesia bovis T2Bo]